MTVFRARALTLSIALAALFAGGEVSAAPQQADPQAAAPAPQTTSDRAVDPSQPDFTLIGLPMTLRIPKFGSAFRVTHRFTRALGAGDFGDLLGDAFGVDGGAQVGLEYRFGLLSGTQIGIHRTSDRTIQLFLQHQLFRQGGRLPVGIDVIGTVEGAENLSENHSPAIGAVVSRTVGRRGAIYAQPIWVNNTNPHPSEIVDDNDTFIVGFGGRARVLSTVYVIAEAAPRVGYSPNATYVSFAVEKRWGGHSFQVNFSNGFGTTLGQIASGGTSSDGWYLGFNISRKFF